MLRDQAADVIIVGDADESALLKCATAVLEESGQPVRRLTVVTERPGDSAEIERLESLHRLEHCVNVEWDASGVCPIDAINRTIAELDADVALLAADRIVAPGWLRELGIVAHSEERTACVSPLTEADLIAPAARAISGPDRYACAEDLAHSAIARACEGLPRWTVAPVLSASCIYLRGDVLAAVGLLSTDFTTLTSALDDWVMRALDLGFVAKRANRVYLRRSPHFLGGARFSPFDRTRHTVLKTRHPYLERLLAGFDGSLDARLAEHALRLATTGTLPVALDIRHLPREQVGTRTYAVSLAQALADLSELELTLLVRDPAQAEGLPGRVVTPESWSDDVALIHKPAQVIDARELALLFRSSAHIVITFQDLIAYRIPSVFPSDASFDGYRATSGLTVQAVQGILAYSKSAAREISGEFGVPAEEVAVVPLGVDTDWFARRHDRDDLVRRRLELPERYFFSVATEFRNKNLANLLEAYAILRNRWSDGEPPALVLAGYTMGGRTRFYARFEASPMGEGVVLLGPVSKDDLRVLYQHALALVFPSLYEGFGLPPLESLAAGTPVIAMPLSAMSEVVADAALYPAGLSPADLAGAMELLASDQGLRAALSERGSRRITQFRWEQTARATFEVYRSTVLKPSERSLRMRRLLQASLIQSAEAQAHATSRGLAGLIDPMLLDSSIGIRNAVKVLSVALQARFQREIGRVSGAGQRKKAS
jgi:glycosyltransferase involved in cell wall biosynthesis